MVASLKSLGVKTCTIRELNSIDRKTRNCKFELIKWSVYKILLLPFFIPFRLSNASYNVIDAYVRVGIGVSSISSTILSFNIDMLF